MADLTSSIDISGANFLPYIQSLNAFIQEVEEENPNHLPLDWIVNQIKEHSLSYVRIGYLAAKVKVCKLWDRARNGIRFGSFQQWCEIALGKSVWQINRLIEASEVVIALTKAGFTYLPQNEAQARPLVKLWKDDLANGNLEGCGDKLVNAWDEVLRSLPQHGITASAIAEIVGGKTEQSHRIEIDHSTYETLARKAAEVGLTPKQLLKQLIEGDSPTEPDPETENFTEPDSDPTDDTPVVTQQQLQRWEEDLIALVNEGDRWVQPSLSNSS
ncbi:MAG: hypothetical protein VKJ46_15945 [Leptolyngbyaceae bacterium]|nr:hypothetical protein [Leptolyngbyaceae bacterium]